MSQLMNLAISCTLEGLCRTNTALDLDAESHIMCIVQYITYFYKKYISKIIETNVFHSVKSTTSSLWITALITRWLNLREN